MRLAILSDTHGLLRPEVVECLKTADAILHAGDILFIASLLQKEACIMSDTSLF